MTDTDLDERFARAHGALRTVAVTGTNGKTTTTSMVASIVSAAAEVAPRLTTLGAWLDADRVVAANGAEEFLLLVEGAVRRGARTIALEVTSKALAGGFARRWPADVAVFTNLTRDHLDMHGSPEAYLAAKAQAFMALAPRHGTAVLNGDDPSSALIAEVIRPGVAVRRFSMRDLSVDLAATAVRVSAAGTEITLAPGRLADALGGALSLNVIGDVHAQNALAAALAGDALGYDARAIREGLRAFPGVPGRFEIVAREPLVAIDYAHTPDGLDGTLRTARALAGPKGRVVCVFGCGGERDRGKRPEMGALAHRLADVVVLTNDNPRRESPEAIAAQIRAGALGEGAEWCVELDRRAAIELAVGRAGERDVIVIAGKGHEHVQEIGTEGVPFSDAAVARAAHAVAAAARG